MLRAKSAKIFNQKYAVGNTEGMEREFENLIQTFRSDIEEIHFDEFFGKQSIKVTLKTELNVPNDFFWRQGTYVCLRNCMYGGMWQVVRHDKTNLYLEISHFLSIGGSKTKGYSWEVVKQEKDSRQPFYLRENTYNPDQAQTPFLFLCPPIRLYCRCSIMSISTIDIIGQNYQSNFFVEIRIRELSVVADETIINEFLDIVKFKTIIHFVNIFSEDQDESWDKIELSYFDADLYDHVLRIRKNAVLTEHMELKDFPYDEQELSISLRFNKPLGSFVVVHNEEWPSVIATNSFALSDIYDIAFQEMVFGSTGCSDPKESASGISYPIITFTIAISRRAGYHESNVMIPASLFAMLSLLSFSVSEDGAKIDTGSRLSITLTLLLTSVAYKFVVANSIPQVSYNTMLDWYVWGTLIYILLCAVENAIFPLLVSIYGTEMSSSELYVLIAFILVYALGNIVYFALVIYRLQKRKYITAEKFKQEETLRNDAKKRVEEIKLSRVKLTDKTVS
jgi:hypothetical protein